MKKHIGSLQNVAREDFLMIEAGAGLVFVHLKGPPYILTPEEARMVSKWFDKAAREADLQLADSTPGEAERTSERR